MPNLRASALGILCLTAVGLAQAQPKPPVKPDGEFRAVLGIGASLSTGNSEGGNLSITADGVRATSRSKTSVFGNAQYARADGTTTAERLRLGGRQDQDFGETVFGFGGAEVERNRFANLRLRTLLSGGVGIHQLKTPLHSVDLFGGLGHTGDRYFSPTLIDGATRDRYGYLSLLLGAESTHKLSETTSAKQKFVLLPNLRHSGQYRATWDAGLSVSMTRLLALTVGLSVAHNSEPGPGRKSTDALLTSGVSLKFD